MARNLIFLPRHTQRGEREHAKELLKQRKILCKIAFESVLSKFFECIYSAHVCVCLCRMQGSVKFNETAQKTMLSFASFLTF